MSKGKGYTQRNDKTKGMAENSGRPDYTQQGYSIVILTRPIENKPTGFQRYRLL